MSKQSHDDSPSGVSLFPFLAVLLCTMGALIVVLVVLSRQVRPQVASAPTEPQRNEAGLTPVEEAELLELEIAQLQSQLAATEEDLAARRAQLGQIEDHSRELQRQLEALQQAAAALTNAATSEQQSQELRQQLALLERRRREVEEALAEARQGGSGNSPSYAIIPYGGENGTRRRPIYLECLDDAVVLQPEGLVFTAADFDGPLGPGNPLASAVRAVAEYWTALGAPSGAEPQQPYPLLIVRASGVRAYYVARAALRSWDSEFGYELVDDEWKLDYPKPDPKLAGAVTKAAVEARQREALAAAAAPRLRGRQTRTVGSSPTGRGMVRQEVVEGPRPRRGGFDAGFGPRPGSDSGPGAVGGWVADGQGGGRWYQEGLAHGDGSLPYADVEVPPVQSGGGAPGGGELPGDGGARGAGSGQFAELSSAPGGVSADSETAAASGLYGEGAPGDAALGDAALGDGAPGDAWPADDLAGAGTAGGAPSAGQVAEADPSSVGDSWSGQGTDRAGGSPGSSEATIAGRPAARGAASPAAGGRGSATVAGGQGTSAGGDPSGGRTRQTAGGTTGTGSASDPASGSFSVEPGPPPDPNCRSMAEARGRNWGVPNPEGHVWPVTRPVRLVCCGDRIVVAASNGQANSGKIIPLPGPTEEGIDELVRSVWQQTRAWGIAGHGMYWQPILSCDIAPGGEGRFTDLTVLLAESGLEVRRRGADRLAAPQAAPSTTRQR